ncbi:unnamed protein product [Symbiodinium sp. CCMP2592]|nr:unnamed protein product [Symbiodinium sp. CCMP2592]
MSAMFTCCSPRDEKKTALLSFAKALSKANLREKAEPKQTAFPMYALPAEVFLQMSEMQPHEDLLFDGVLVEFDRSAGKAMFVSHQWVGRKHPDPEFRQARVLQQALLHMLSDLQKISTDAITEVINPDAKDLDCHVFRTSSLFLWYDYFCIPQACDVDKSPGISSIPQYVDRSDFFVILSPVIASPTQSAVFTPSTWGERGWCLIEKVIRDLSNGPPCILINGARNMQLVPKYPVMSHGVAPGEGMFANPSDRDLLGPVVKSRIREAALEALNRQDLVSYRFTMNMQTVLLRGFQVDPVEDILPLDAAHGIGASNDLQCELEPSSQRASRFMYQNGFRKVRGYDSSGWSPLLYAALSGDPLLIEGLLKQRANPNDTTRKGSLKAGVGPGVTVLGVCVYMRNHEAMPVLTAFGARTCQGPTQAMIAAAYGNNSEGVRLLQAMRASLHIRDLFGLTPLEEACLAGSVDATYEILAQASSDPGFGMDVSNCLHYATYCRGGTVDLVMMLVDHKADVNKQFSVSLSHPVRMLAMLQSIQYRLGKRTLGCYLGFQLLGATPLMLAVISQQYEAAAALITLRAQLDIKNSRGRTALHLAEELGAPLFLLEALRGNISDCSTITFVAMANGPTETLVF